MSAIRWLDHTADCGFRVTGPSLEDAFCEAGRALFSLMFAIETIRGSTAYSVALSAPSLEALLVEWLSELLAQKDLSRLVFSRFEVKISGNAIHGFSAVGRAFGEKLDRDRHQPRTEVKGISYLGLDVTCADGACVAQVVVDV